MFTNRTSESQHAFGGLGRCGGDDACVESMLGYVRHVGMLFGRTSVPVVCVVGQPLA